MTPQKDNSIPTDRIAEIRRFIKNGDSEGMVFRSSTYYLKAIAESLLIIAESVEQNRSYKKGQ